MSGNKAKSTAAQGTLLLMVAQMVFMAAGYGVNILLALKLPQVEYGKYAIVMVTLVWVELFVINGLPTVMQRFIPSGEYPEEALIRFGIRGQLLYGIVILILFVAVVPVLSILFSDGSLKTLFFVASIDIVIYGMYWLYAGVLSGKKHFVSQAIAIIAYSLGKLAGISLLIIAGLGIKGALIGNWLGSCVGLIAAIKFVQTKKLKIARGVKFSLFRHFIVSIVTFTITINLLLNMDIFFVKRFLTDLDVAYYYNASTLARIPYFVFLAISFTLLPVLAKSITSGAESGARRQITLVMRFLLVLLTPVVLFLWQNALATIEMFYTAKYAEAASILPYLTLGLAIFTLLSIVTTIMNADNRPGLALWVALIAVGVDAVANYFLVNLKGTIGAAQATTLASLVGLIIGGSFVYKRFKTFLPILTVVRVLFMATITTVIFNFWHIGPKWVVPKAFGFFTIYGIGLFVLKEIEIGEILGIFQRPGSHSAKSKPEIVV